MRGSLVAAFMRVQIAANDDKSKRLYEVAISTSSKPSEALVTVSQPVGGVEEVGAAIVVIATILCGD